MEENEGTMRESVCVVILEGQSSRVFLGGGSCLQQGSQVWAPSSNSLQAEFSGLKTGGESWDEEVAKSSDFYSLSSPQIHQLSSSLPHLRSTADLSMELKADNFTSSGLYEESEKGDPKGYDFLNCTWNGT